MCKAGVVLALGGGLAGAAEVPRAGGTSAGYDEISQRNVFALRAPEQPAAMPSMETPPPVVFLTGITTVMGVKRALFKTVLPGAGPGLPAREDSYFLSEGQREGPVEVVSIDENAGTVRLRDGGQLMTVDFEKNGNKDAGGGAGAGRSAVGGSNAGGGNRPGMGAPSALGSPGGRLPSRAMPSRLSGRGSGPASGGAIPSPTGYGASQPPTVTEPQERQEWLLKQLSEELKGNGEGNSAR